MGNSEVGHLNLGAGAIVKQDLTLIDEAAAAAGLRRQRGAARRDARRAARAPVGLVSDGGVHSSIEHLGALIEMAARAGVRDLVVHAITDGRDTLPHRRRRLPARPSRRWCERRADARDRARVASVIGRYFAMDRDNRWERVQAAYDLLVHGIAEHGAPTAPRRRRRPTSAARPTSSSRATTRRRRGPIRPGDSVIAFNFRPDRMRELSAALAAPECPGSTAAARRRSSATRR